MEVEYEIERRTYNHVDGDVTLFTVVTVYPGGLRHISSSGADDFKTMAEAEAEVERRIAKGQA